MSNSQRNVESDDEKKPITEQIADSAQGRDEPMEKSHPEAPPMLVIGSYPIFLFVGVVMLAIFYWFYYGQ